MRLPDWLAPNHPCRNFKTPESLFEGLAAQRTDAILCAQIRVLGSLKKILRGFGLPDDLADDVLNRSTLIFLQKIESGGYQFQSHAPTTFLVEIIRRVALMATRTQKRAAADPLENHLEIADPDIEKTAKNQEAAELVRHFLTRLGEPCATVVRLHHIEGFSDEAVVRQQLTRYSTTDSLKMKRSDCMKKLIQLATAWKTSTNT